MKTITMKTITIEGKEIKISNESYEKLKKQFLPPQNYDDIVEKELQERCYFIDENGTISIWTRVPERHFSKAMISKTKDQLESINALNKLCNVAKYLNSPWLPDWTNSHLPKYYIRYNYVSNQLEISNNSMWTNSIVYFKTKELAEKAINILDEEEIKKALTLNH